METDVRILRLQKVRYFRREWIDSELTLFSDGKLDFSEDKDTITYASNTTRPIYGNFDFVFVVNTRTESQFYSGPRFAVKDYQSCERWMQLLNLVHQLKKQAKIHPHPLSFSKYTGSKFNCSICTATIDGVKGSEQWTCEFCEYNECNICHENINNGENFVKSANHPHLLMRMHQSYETWLSADNRGPYKCKVCKSPTDEEAHRYHCVECGDYDECPSCISKLKIGGPALSNSDLKLNLGHLDHVIKTTDGSNLGKLKVDLGNLTKFIPASKGVFTLDVRNCGKGQKYPKNMSVTTDKYWDLSSIDKTFPTSAYFEVTFHKIKGLAGLGLGNQIHSQSQLLGHQQNSFGVLSDGAISYNKRQNAIKVPGIQFAKNDVIGLGVIFDTFNQRRVFFTKNGQYAGSFDQTVHRGMDCYPGISMAADSKAIFSVNFKGPFKFELKSLPNSLTVEKADQISSLPNELREKIGTFASFDVHALTWRLVSKSFNSAMSSNTVWRALFMKTWPKQNPNLKLKSWMNFYKKRVLAFKSGTSAPVRQPDPLKTKKHAIDNCDFEFECPMLWENLKRHDYGGDLSGNAFERTCDKCQKAVYRVTDPATAQKFTEMGRCVSFIELEKVGKPPKGPVLHGMRMGKVARLEPARYIDLDPFDDKEKTTPPS